MTTDAAVAELLDKEVIRGLIYTYSRAIDRHDPDLLRSIYHPDAIDDHGRFVGTADEFARYAMGRMDAEFECTYHAMQHYHRPARRRSPRRDLHVGIHISRGDTEPQTIDVLACSSSTAWKGEAENGA
jgi:hypothetical protein